ncbi:glycosyltransferase [Balneolales bacterium ANBcel1]|nr:glycosyltransferase [Balneolales bacterium ANBcel1]
MKGVPEHITVVHSFPVWLPQTQTWLYNQVRSLPENVTSHIVCKSTGNLDQFHLPNIHALMGGYSRLSDISTRALRHVDYHLYTALKINAIRPQILHSHFGTVGWKNDRMLRLLPGQIRRNIRHVVTFYGQDVVHIPKTKPVWRKRYRKMFRNVDMVLCEGTHMAMKVRELGCPAEIIRVHHLGVDLEAIPFRPRKKRENQPCRILMAAAFRPKKGFLYGLRALERISARHDIEVTLVGDSTGDNISELEKQRIESFVAASGLAGKVAYTGFLSQHQLNRLAADHHIYLAPSVTAEDGDSEGGAPVSLIEMAASGMPVVSSRHCDIPEVLPENECGLLADERDVDELEAHLDLLLSHPESWLDLTVTAREHLESHYDAKKQGESLSRKYFRLLMKRPAKPASGKPRILFLSHSGDLYGAERSLLSLVSDLQRKKDYGIMVFVPREGPLTKALQGARVPYRVVPMVRWTGNRMRSIMRYARGFKRRWYRSRLLEEATDFRPDIIYTNTLAIDAGAFLKTRLGNHPPHIWHARELAGHPDFGFFDSGTKKALSAVARSTDLLVCNSRYLRKYLEMLFADQGIRPPPAEVVHNGFSFPNSRPISRKSGKENTFRIVMAGSISPLKNYAEGIRAVRLLADEGIPVSLDIYGDGNKKDNRTLNSVIQSLGGESYVALKGYRSDLKPVFSNADLLLVTSRLESFGRVAVEAMGHGCPVVSTGSGGLPEIVKNRETGLLYSSGNEAELANAIRELYRDPELRNTLTDNAFEFVKTHFSMSRYISDMHRLIRTLTPEEMPPADTEPPASGSDKSITLTQAMRYTENGFDR